MNMDPLHEIVVIGSVVVAVSTLALARMAYMRGHDSIVERNRERAHRWLENRARDSRHGVKQAEAINNFVNETQRLVGDLRDAPSAGFFPKVWK